MSTALTVLSLAALFVCQAPAQPPTFRARIDLVQVDVVVVDRDGNPVRGLTSADFMLLDRGKAQAIVNFDEVSHARPRAGVGVPPPAVKKDVADNQTAQSGRLVVMVVDDLHIYKDRTDRAKEIARRVLADLGPESSMAVLFTSGEHSTQVTDDQSTLRAAVDTLKGRQSWRRPHVAVDRQRGGRIDAEASAAQQLAVVQATQDATLQDFFDNLTQYKLLQDAARMLGVSDARRKAFVLLSEGIGKDLSGLFGAMAPAGDVPEGGIAYASGNTAALASSADTPYHDNALVDMMESLRRSNVATYAIDPRGKVESKDLARECFPAPHPGEDPCSNKMAEWYSVVRLAQHGLEIASEASGGFAVTNTDDFTSGLKKIVDDLDHYYLLGFYPADQKGKGYRALDVRSPGRPDVKLRFRRGYMPGGPPPAKNTTEMIALAAGVLPKPDLPLRLSAIPLPGAGAAARVVLTLEVSPPRRALQEADGKVRDTLKYEVLIVDEKKAKVRSVSGLEAHLTLAPIDAARVPPEVASYQVSETLDVLPGHYEFRVSAMSAKLAKGGSVYLAVDVPDFRAPEPLVSGLAINYADGVRVPSAPRTIAPARQAGAARGMMPAPVPPPALPFPPSLDREFTAGDTLRVYFEAPGRNGTRQFPGVEIVDSDNKIVRAVSPSFTSGDPVRIEATIPLASLRPGSYVLRATLTDGSRSASRETAFVIR
jgi:VWFA-related protein